MTLNTNIDNLVKHIQLRKLSLNEGVRQLRTAIGRTPLIPIDTIWTNKNVKIYAKAEWMQLGGSVKARAALQMVEDGIRSGQITRKRGILDATSGNTGIALASIGKALGIPVTLCLPENASTERKEILHNLGAEIIFTSPLELTDGAQDHARMLAELYPEKYFYTDQYSNANNWLAHYFYTAPEILQQTRNQVTHFVAGLGTTGTFTGTTRKLKEYNKNIQSIALQPETALHGLEGWKHLPTAYVPPIFDQNLADKTLEIDTLGVYDLIKEAATKEGLLLSPSAAANLLGAMQVAEQLKSGVVVTVFPDNADKYSEVMDQIFKK